MGRPTIGIFVFEPTKFFKRLNVVCWHFEHRARRPELIVFSAEAVCDRLMSGDDLKASDEVIEFHFPLAF